MCVGVDENLTLVCGNQVLQKLFAGRVEKERLAGGYAGEPRSIDQGMRISLSRHFSIALGLKAADDCQLGASESYNTSRLLVVIDGSPSTSRTMELSTAWGVPPGFALKTETSFCEPGEPVADDVDGVLPQCAVDVADCSSRSIAPAPLAEDDC